MAQHKDTSAKIHHEKERFEVKSAEVTFCTPTDTAVTKSWAFIQGEIGNRPKETSAE